MPAIGYIESLWRYPVKSMRGEEMRRVYLGYAGIYGDRLYAFRSAAAPAGFPYLTGREQEALLLYRPMYRYGEQTIEPPNLPEAEALGSGLTPVYADASALMVDVETPAGERLAIDDPALIDRLRKGLRERHELSLLRSDRAMTDCRPVSLFSIQTAQQLSDEMGVALDKRRFRANIYLQLDSGAGFGEDHLVGQTLRLARRPS